MDARTFQSRCRGTICSVFEQADREQVNKGKIKGGGGGRIKGDAYHHVVTELIIDFFYRFYPFLFFVPWHCSTPSLSLRSSASAMRFPVPLSLLRGSQPASDGFKHLANSSIDRIWMNVLDKRDILDINYTSNILLKKLLILKLQLVLFHLSRVIIRNVYERCT